MVYSLILNIAVTVEKTHKSEWAMGQNIANDIWQFLIWAVLTEKSIKDARVLLSFCHTSENMVYSLILNIAATVEKTHKSEWAMSQNIANDIWQFLIWAVLTKKKY